MCTTRVCEVDGEAAFDRLYHEVCLWGASRLARASPHYHEVHKLVNVVSRCFVSLCYIIFLADMQIEGRLVQVFTRGRLHGVPRSINVQLD